MKSWQVLLDFANELLTQDTSLNTVHLTIKMVVEIAMVGRGLARGGRSGKLLILRLTPRGLRRLRLDTTRSCRISMRTAR
jgi:hypothetical protein